ncbi:ABC transporter ATP-binding protein [Aeromicrobium alkaliterrae]|uniref:ABC transporter ATP-binding protein n=1 Tax=Aeromicrobium alkaliterrae TaxID=302168 RepID=A0ABN2K4M6_9ACTN
MSGDVLSQASASAAAPEATPLLETRGLSAGYGQSLVLRDVDLAVGPGQVAVVLGANGAGKTTLMRSLAGLLPFSGDLLVDGQKVGAVRPDRMVGRGISLVPQGRGTMSALSVHDNLRAGAVSRRDKAGVEEDVDRWFTTFPRLAERRDQAAGTLSGGEQQMLAIARALMSRPRLLLCDEISLGLAPRIVQELFETIAQINVEMGTALLLVEQNAALAMKVASYVYLLEVGEVVQHGDAREFEQSDSIRRVYLGY